MKNLGSLVLVLCLLIVLGCNCQSDFIDSIDKKTPVPAASATPASTPVAVNTPRPYSTPAEKAKKVLEIGTYTGTGENVTAKKRGDFMLRIDSVSASGNVKAFFRASNGLFGSSTMTGKIDDEGKLSLDGTLEDGKAISISATVSGDTIEAGYGIADAKLNTQSGNFTVTLE